jgi:hypothetical protein
MSVPELQDLRDRPGAFERISAIWTVSTALSGGDHAERIETLGTGFDYSDSPRRGSPRHSAAGIARRRHPDVDGSSARTDGRPRRHAPDDQPAFWRLAGVSMLDSRPTRGSHSPG